MGLIAQSIMKKWRTENIAIETMKTKVQRDLKKEKDQNLSDFCDSLKHV